MPPQQDNLRQKIALGFAFVLFIWPLFHMIWAHGYGLNATKLSGWGMYTVARTRTIGITVIRLDDQAEIGSLANLSRVMGTSQLLSLRGDNLQELGELSTRSPKVTQAVRYVRTFRNRLSVDHLLQCLRNAQNWNNAKLLVLISEPRVSVSNQLSFTSNDFYFGDESETRFLGRYSSAQMEAQEILACIGDQI